MTRTPAAVWAVVGLHGFLLVVTSVLYPTYRAPDESAHVDMVLAVGDTAGYPRIGERTLSRRIVASHGLVGFDLDEEEVQPLCAREARPREDRPTFAAFGPDTATGVPQQMAAHPPLYYVVGAAAISAVTALVPAAYDWSFDQVVGFLRLCSAAIVLPLPLLAYRIVERLRAPGHTALAAAFVPLAIPGFTHVGASVTNDALLALLVGVLTLVAVTIAGGDLRLRTAVGAGLVTGLALLTKGFALFTPVLLIGAYAVAVLRGGGPAGLSRSGVALATALATGGWWWIRNLLLYDTVQPAGLPSPPAPGGFVPDISSWLPFYLGRLNRFFWFGPDIVSPDAPPFDLLATGALLLLVVAAFVGHRGVAQRPLDLALLLAPLVGLAAIVTFGSWRVYARSGLALAIHGRYLYAAVTGVAGLAAIGAAVVARGATRWLPLASLAVVVAAQVAAGALALRTYWGPAGLERVSAVLAWSPWPAAVPGAAVAGAAALTAWLASTQLAHARTQGAHPNDR